MDSANGISVDWAGAVAPQSFDERIHSDLVAHSDLEPRLVLIQPTSGDGEELSGF